MRIQRQFDAARLRLWQLCGGPEPGCGWIPDEAGQPRLPLGVCGGQALEQKRAIQHLEEIVEEMLEAKKNEQENRDRDRWV